MLQTHFDILPTNNQQSDQELVTLAQQGSMAAFTTLYERHLPSVSKRVCYLIPEQDIEDVTQEVFMAVMKSLKSFRGDAQFSTWLRTLTNRNIANYYRRRERTKDHLNLELNEMNIHSIPNPMTNAAKTIDERVVLRQGLRALPEHYREVIVLRFAEGMRFNEIAEARGQSLEATKSLFRRALSALRTQLVTCYD
jgi:RNA polymerase sigma-70 factor (ECF subfamily)